MNIFHITKLAQDYASTAITKGDKVIDATAGNGADTVFLAEKVGQTGQVYAFDIQEDAIKNTKAKVLEKAYESRVQLIQDSHANIDQYVQGPISCAMFNLGYLPKGDPAIITKGASSIKALKKSLELLKVNGIITICVYTSHEGGVEEASIVEAYLKVLDKYRYKVLKYSCLNDQTSPYIVLIARMK
ncbi:class I SAM-dependent methyltransferase [Alkalibaculum bacchi]|uniref:tRNA (mnm(5)s(2)U34)-methyltransferase n=1 Tax=Alkalibaculum bacchi TaxID=645887 RepID=UPI0026ED2269|nr:class I SAM-dependent methyltransferase [Alkalibaculum bacchi]